MLYFQILTITAFGMRGAALISISPQVRVCAVEYERGNAMRRKENKSAAWGKRILGSFALVLISSLAVGQSSKLSSDLQKQSSNSATNVIVQYYNAPGTRDSNAAAAVGATNGKKLGHFKGNGYTMSPAAASKLVSLDTNVKYISVDRKLQMASVTANDSVMNTTVSANLARSIGYDGTGVGVAVIDSGVNPTPDLGIPGSSTNRIVYSANFDPSANTTSDLFGHGQHHRR